MWHLLENSSDVGEPAVPGFIIECVGESYEADEDSISHEIVGYIAVNTKEFEAQSDHDPFTGIEHAWIGTNQ